ncbi:MAG TPA: DinB family protein [Ilumatobacter sp.]
MSSLDVKGDLHDYLRGARETLVWKLEGLGEYDIRRPLTPTGTNLLGLVKHNAGMEVMYFGEVFGRTPDVSLPWLVDDAEANADMWARPDETRERIVELYRRTWELADATINELPLDAVGQVCWWGDSPVTLHRVLVHVTSETQRHAGLADIIRESVDGSAGFLSGYDSLRISDPAAWKAFHDRIEEAARLADGD